MSSEDHPPSEDWASGGVPDIVDPHVSPRHSRIGNVIRRIKPLIRKLFCAAAHGWVECVGI
jgi:hypothetical protein